MPAKSNWSPAQLDELHARLLRGEGLQRIALAMGFKHGAVRSKVSALQWWGLATDDEFGSQEEKRFHDANAMASTELLSLLQKNHPEGDPYARA
jgi:hypothetical protein